MHTAVLVVGIGVFAFIAYSDVRTRRIPNALSLAIAILGLIRIILVHDLVAAEHTLAVAAAVFAVAFLLFSCGTVGGGDAKLVTAVALLIGYQELFGFLFLMSLGGGALALVILARDRLGTRWRGVPWPARMPSPTEATEASAVAPRSTVPYGVAIAAAGVITLILKSPLIR